MTKAYLTALQVASLSSDPNGGKSGQVYFNTTTNKFRGYTTTWQDLGSGSNGGGGTGTSNSFEVLAQSPASPAQGRTYFDSSENTIKVYNGEIWYDVAGPKELLDHQHYAGDGSVKYVDYGNYVEFGNYLVSMDGGSASSNYSSAPNNDIIDGGGSI